MANTHMKRCSTLLVTVEMQIKTMRYYIMLVRITKIIKKKKNLQIRNVREDVEKREPLYTVSGNVNWCSHYGKLYGDSSKL